MPNQHSNDTALNFSRQITKCNFIILGPDSFSLKKIEPETLLVVKEGESFRISCEVDNYFEYCKFIHTDKICDSEWKRDDWNITVAKCKDNEGHMEWSGGYNYYGLG